MLFILFLQCICRERRSHPSTTANASYFWTDPSNYLNNKFRIGVNTKYLYTLNNSQMCESENQIITWNNSQYTCKLTDIITQNQTDALLNTFSNVLWSFDGTYSVKNLQDPIQFKTNKQFLDVTDNFTISNIDLYITLVIRPFDDDKSDIFAISKITDFDQSNYRPTQGIIAFNPKLLPSVEESYWDPSNQLYAAIYQQIFILMGLHSDMFRYYHSKTDMTPYTDILCNLTRYGRKFIYLTTPSLRKFAESIDSNVPSSISDECPSGVEMIDHGFDIGLRPAGRLFFTDIMVTSHQRNPYLYHRVTDLTLSWIEDTGNYEMINRIGQPLVYGNPQVYNTKDSDFFYYPPQTVFPKSFLYNESDASPENTISFDFSFSSVGQGVPINCTEESESEFCKYPEFYNPYNLATYYPWPEYDYQPIKMPKLYCQNMNEAAIPGMLTDATDSCGDYRCDNNNTKFAIFFITNEKTGDYTSIQCTNNEYQSKIGITVNRLLVNGSTKRFTLRCPNPKTFCEARQLFLAYYVNGRTYTPYPTIDQRTPNEPTLIQFDPSRSPSIEQAKNPWLMPLIISSAATFLIVMILIITLLVCFFTNSHDYSDISDNDTTDYTELENL